MRIVMAGTTFLVCCCDEVPKNRTGFFGTASYCLMTRRQFTSSLHSEFGLPLLGLNPLLAHTDLLDALGLVRGCLPNLRGVILFGPPNTQALEHLRLKARPPEHSGQRQETVVLRGHRFHKAVGDLRVD